MEALLRKDQHTRQVTDDPFDYESDDDPNMPELLQTQEETTEDKELEEHYRNQYEAWTQPKYKTQDDSEINLHSEEQDSLPGLLPRGTDQDEENTSVFSEESEENESERDEEPDPDRSAFQTKLADNTTNSTSKDPVWNRI